MMGYAGLIFELIQGLVEIGKKAIVNRATHADILAELQEWNAILGERLGGLVDTLKDNDTKADAILKGES